MQSYQGRGYACELIESNERIRISVFATSDKQEAFDNLELIRAKENNNAIFSSIFLLNGFCGCENITFWSSQ